MLALVQANDYGWTSTRTLTEFAIAVVGLVAFGVSQLRQREPMLDLDFFRNRNFNAGNVTAFLVTFSMFATFFFVTLYMQNVERPLSDRDRRAVPADDDPDHRGGPDRRQGVGQVRLTLAAAAGMSLVAARCSWSRGSPTAPAI